MIIRRSTTNEVEYDSEALVSNLAAGRGMRNTMCRMQGKCHTRSPNAVDELGGETKMCREQKEVVVDGR